MSIPADSLPYEFPIAIPVLALPLRALDTIRCKTPRIKLSSDFHFHASAYILLMPIANFILKWQSARTPQRFTCNQFIRREGSNPTIGTFARHADRTSCRQPLNGHVRVQTGRGSR
jgi:hypothetical protein